MKANDSYVPVLPGYHVAKTEVLDNRKTLTEFQKTWGFSEEGFTYPRKGHSVYYCIPSKMFIPVVIGFKLEERGKYKLFYMEKNVEHNPDCQLGDNHKDCPACKENQS